MKRKLLFLAALVASALTFNANAKKDVTNLIANADLSKDPTSSDNGWTCEKKTDWGTSSDDAHTNVMEFWAGSNYSGGKFKISQSVNLPRGYYHLVVNAFYRNGGGGDGTNNHNAWIFAGEKTDDVVALNSMNDLAKYTGSNDMWRGANAFKLGDFKNEFDFQVTTDGATEIGFEGQNFANNSWCILGPVTLYEYETSDYIADYKALVPTAEALFSSKMNATVLATLKEAAGKEEGDMSDIDNAYKAVETLKAAIKAAEVSIANYAAVKPIIDLANGLAKKGKETYTANETVKALIEGYEAGTLESMSAEQKTAAETAYLGVIKTYPAPGADFTLTIENPSFETNDMSGWTNSGTENLGPQTNDSFDRKVGNVYAERWHADGTLNLKQTVTGLPAGKYILSANIYSEPEGSKIVANEASTTITAWNSNVYEVEAIVEEDGNLEIGVECTLTGSTWFCVDDFKLTLVELTIPELTNPKFDANPEDVVTVTTQGYQGNVKDDQVAGLQTVQAWTRNHDTPKAGTSGDGYTGGVFAYGSTNLLNNKVAAPATDPEGNSEGVALGVAAVWTGVAQYTQDITLPAGNYVITYPVYNGANTGALTKSLLGFIAADGKEYTSEQKQFAVIGEWMEVIVPFTLEEKTTGKISVGVNGGNHGSGAAPHLFVDQVRFSMVSDEELAVAKAKAAKTTELNKLTVSGNGIFNYPPAATLEAIKNAKTVEEVEAIEMPALILPKEGQPYTLTLTTATGQFYLNTSNGVKIETEATPIYLVPQDGGKYALYDGTEYVNYAGGNNWDISLTEGAYGWTINALAEGQYSIQGKNGLLATNNSGGNPAGDNAGSACYGDKNTGNANYIWAITEYVPTVTVTEALYSTYVPKVDVNFTGVEAYIVSGLNEDNTVATLTSITEAPAGTPVVIKAAKADTYELKVVAEAEEVTGNLLKVATGEETGEGIYVLANLTQGVGFYALDTDVKVPAGKAYLEVAAGGGIKFIGFEGNGGATGIQGVEDAAEVENGAIYNLAGQRVQNPTKGIYIVNGKKVLVK